MAAHFRRIGPPEAPDPLLFEYPVHEDMVHSMLVLPSDGTTLVSGSEKGSICVVELETRNWRWVAGHDMAVNQIACSPDGALLVSASDDKTVRIWNTKTWELVRTLEGHADQATRVVVTPNGKKIISGANDGELRVWDLATGECLLSFQQHDERIEALTLVPGRPEVISASMDATIIRWNYDLGDIVRVIEERGDAGKTRRIEPDVVEVPANKSGVGHTTWPQHMAVTDDGRWLVSVAEEIILTDLESGAQRANHGKHPWRLEAMLLSRDERRIAVGGEAVRIYAFDDGRELATIPGRDVTVNSLAVDANERWLCVGLKSGSIRVYDHAMVLAGGVAARHARWVNEAVISADGRTGATASNDGTVGLWDLATGALRGFGRHVNPILDDGAFTPDGTRFVVTSSQGEVLVLDATTGEIVVSMQRKECDWIHALAILPDGKSALAAGHGPGLARWNLVDGGAPLVLEGETSRVLGIVVSSDGGTAFTCSSSEALPEGVVTLGRLQCWDLATNKLRWTATVDEGYPRRPTLLDGGRVIATAGSTGRITLWNAATGTEIRSWVAHPKYINDLYPLPGGRLMSTAHMTPPGTKRIYPVPFVCRVWDVETGALVLDREKENVGSYESLVVDEGRALIVAGADAVWRWNLDTGRHVAARGTWRMHALAVSPDGRTVLAGGEDGAVHILAMRARREQR